ncbi:Cys-rich protein [Leptospira sp. 96542]|nr:Cys-rich protein [Leptospira sp. 96542]
MKKTKRFFSILAALVLFSGTLTAADFPKCKEACDKFYNCTLQVNPSATEEQKNMLRRGCEFNCNRPKYYTKISSCLTSAGDTCKNFSACIGKEMQAMK